MNSEFKSLPKEAQDAFQSLLCRLSPENLACDGEIPQSQVRARYKQIKREWAELEKKYNVSLNPDYLY